MFTIGSRGVVRQPCASAGRRSLVHLPIPRAYTPSTFALSRPAGLTPQASAQMSASTSAAAQAEQVDKEGELGFTGLHHVGILCSDLARSIKFYEELLGLKVNPERPHDKLPYKGAWFWMGPEMVHLMELPNPDPLEGRPEHGGRDRHACVGIKSIQPLVTRLEAAGVKYTMSKSGRPAVFFRDPDMNCWEVVELEPWR